VELYNVRLARKAKAEGTEGHAERLPGIAAIFRSSRIDAFVLDPSFHGEAVLGDDLLCMKQRTFPWTKGVPLKS